MRFFVGLLVSLCIVGVCLRGCKAKHEPIAKVNSAFQSVK
jgi:hypothetical protein